MTAPESVIQQRQKVRSITIDGAHFWLSYTKDGLYCLALSGIQVIKDPSLDVVKARALEILYSGKPASQWLDDWLNEDPAYAKTSEALHKIDTRYKRARKFQTDLDEFKRSKLS